MKRKIGIFGGTFDPVHIGHMIAARTAYEQFGLDEMRFMTGGMPPHKELSEVTAADVRHDMVKLATDGETGFVADDFEVSRTTYTYTAKTLELLLDKHPDWEIYFVIGADSLRDILTWYEPQNIAKRCILLVYPRETDTDLDELIKIRSDELKADIRKINAPLIGISSTQIRNRKRDGLSVRYLVPDKVYEYITDNNLYGK